MQVCDVVNYAIRGGIKQVGISNVGDPSTETVTPDQEENLATIVSFINLGLIELYKRFNIRTEEVTFALNDFNRIFKLPQHTLVPTLAVTNDCVELDINNDSSEGSDTLRVFSPNPYMISVSGPIPDGVTEITIIYRASPYIVANLDEYIDLSLAYLEPLLEYITYKAYAPINANTPQENNINMQRFEFACKRIEELGLSNTVTIANNKLMNRGFA
jgi:hypothetical protein